MSHLRNTLALLMGAFITTTMTQCSAPTAQKDLVVKNYFAEKDYDPEDYVDYGVFVDYPVSGPSPLVDSICAAICNVIFLHNEAPTPTIPAGTDLTPVLNRELNAFVQHARKANAELRKEMPNYCPDYWFRHSISLTDNNERYVTYYFSGDYNEGGAHGNPWEYGMSFDRTTGSAIQWDDILTPSGLKAFNDLVYQKIMTEYFAADGFEPWCKPSEMLLNAHPCSALTAEGIKVHYAPYSIGPFSIGAPYCTIPYGVVQTLLTPYGKKLIFGT